MEGLASVRKARSRVPRVKSEGRWTVMMTVTVMVLLLPLVVLLLRVRVV